MAIPKFFKRKTVYVVLVILIAGVWWFTNRNANSGPQYETAPVEQRDLSQTVEVTGEIKPAVRIDLAFKNGGTLSSINVKVGDTVKPGDVLAGLKADDVKFAVRNAAASLSAAQANLNARLAGETSQSIRVAEAQVEQAQAAYDKSVADLTSTKSTAQNSVQSSAIALQTAKNNLDNQDAIVSQNLQNSVDSARLSLLTALGPLNTGLNDGDQISGVDNTAANQTFLNVLGFLDSGSLERAKNSYTIAKVAKLDAESTVKALTSSSSGTDIQAASVKLQNAITLVQAYLGDVQHVLAASLTNSTTFTDAMLSSKKVTIDADRTSVSAQNTAVLSAQQAIKNTELGKTQTIQQLQDAYTAAQTAFNTANTNATVQVRSAETNVSIQNAALDSAKATLDLKHSGPRKVDTAPLQAAVQQAQVALDKANNDLQNVEIIAAVTGTISEIIPSVGEQITPNVPAIRMVGTQTYEIEAEVPEADITKIEVGQTASTTLDAYGDEVVFAGKIADKDPAETRIQDAIYYKVHALIDPAGREVKPGMTANMTINTGYAPNAIVIPLRAVRTDAQTNQKTVRVMVNGSPQVKNVTLGLRGDDGFVQVISGLAAGETVIVGQLATATTGA